MIDNCNWQRTQAAFIQQINVRLKKTGKLRHVMEQIWHVDNKKLLREEIKHLVRAPITHSIHQPQHYREHIPWALRRRNKARWDTLFGGVKFRLKPQVCVNETCFHPVWS